MTKEGVLITQEEYAEFQHLRSLYKLESRLESARQLKTLEADIDAPLKSVVAMLALFGCETAWSCCGFDYSGQPYHKSHHYGKCGIAMLDNEASQELERIWGEADVPFQQKGNRWEFKRGYLYGDGLCYLVSDIETGNTWPDKESIHYSEPGVIALGILKRFLFGLQDRFADSAVVGSFNAVYKARYPDWQYPILENWVISKTDVLRIVREEIGEGVSLEILIPETIEKFTKNKAL